MFDITVSIIDVIIMLAITAFTALIMCFGVLALIYLSYGISEQESLQMYLGIFFLLLAIITSCVLLEYSGLVHFMVKL